MSTYAERARPYYLETGTRPPRRLIWAVSLVKAAAARANAALRLMEADMAKAIEDAALEVANGGHDDEIVVDVYQTGSGTGLNMNVNDIVATIASMKLGRPVHPNDHVNMSQSSNDVIPTAVRLAVLAAVKADLAPSVGGLVSSLRRKGSEFADVIRPGRTHLRDALPITFGQTMEAYAHMIERDLDIVLRVADALREVPLGGTAVGTGANTRRDYPAIAVRELSRLSGYELVPSPSKSALMRSLADVAAISGALRSLALDMLRVSDDLRLLNSGPNTGIAEIEVPVDVPGSSMMPGKRNPVTLEAVNQAAAEVMGLDGAVAWGASLGELELNMGFMVVAYSALKEVELLTEMARKLSATVSSVRLRVERMESLAAGSQALITFMSPYIGYDAASRVAELVASGRQLREALLDVVKDEQTVDRLLRVLSDLRRLTQPLP
mgnify:FL=1